MSPAVNGTPGWPASPSWPSPSSLTLSSLARLIGPMSHLSNEEYHGGTLLPSHNSLLLQWKKGSRTTGSTDNGSAQPVSTFMSNVLDHVSQDAVVAPLIREVLEKCESFWWIARSGGGETKYFTSMGLLATDDGQEIVWKVEEHWEELMTSRQWAFQ
ncbi:hypothetical protein M422DRAFT_51593 [Sphaerobolus stellatus SS14]|uniref:Uncharacterized protein n=1 Tax=Sphaerobolus stellatus (strain SS14) TaxID=990650 RepID=A0A0C9V0N9_SPHS4|nr:hypothetical protein M422DRAFT_51593 [Sphaerobolus stellatus SS14]